MRQNLRAFDTALLLETLVTELFDVERKTCLKSPSDPSHHYADIERS
jgi:hypothetical protein